MSEKDVTLSSPGRGPKRILQGDLSEPRKDQPIVELRFVNPDGDTEVWMVHKESIDLQALSSFGLVRLAYLDKGVDSRLATQRESIDRLLKHLNTHHDEILNEAHNRGADWACDYRDPS